MHKQIIIYEEKERQKQAEKKLNKENPSWKLVYNKIMSKYKETVFDILESIPKKDLRSILLYIFSDIAKKVDEVVLKSEYLWNRFVQPSNIDQRTLHEIESLIYSIIPSWFEWVEFSPVNPIWLNNYLTSLDPKIILSTIRMTEVIADSTTVMSLEASKRRELAIKEWKKEKIVKLCSIQRFLRTQSFPEELKFLPHFKIFALATSWRKFNWINTELEAFSEHIKLYIQILNTLQTNWYFCEDIKIYISDIRIIEKFLKENNLDRKRISKNTTDLDYSVFSELWMDINGKVDSSWLLDKEIWELNLGIDWLKAIDQNVIPDLKDKYPNINVIYDIWRIAWMWYYDSFCFKITAKNKDWLELPLVDWGLSDWTRKMMKNWKEFYMSSWIWLEIFLENFKE